MRHTGRLKLTAAGVGMSLITLTTAGLVLSNSAFASQTMTSTTYLNLRSGPGTGHGVITVLSPSQTVTTTGDTSGIWYEVTTASGQTGWASKTYLQPTDSDDSDNSDDSDDDANTDDADDATDADASTNDAAASAPTASGSATTTSAVNVRSGPGTSYPVLAVAAKGTTLPTTGKTSGGWTEVIRTSKTAWISTSYLTRGSGGDVSTPTTGQVRTTANLYLRTAGTIDADDTGILPAASVVATTGATTADYTEIVYQGERRWIATRYTTAASSSGPSAPSTPTATGSVWVNVGTLNVRATSAADGAIVATVSRGDELKTTGVTSGDRLQVIHNGAARWVYQAYTSTSKPSDDTASSLASSVSVPTYAQLKANAKAGVQHVIATYPTIRTIGGWRASSAYSSDHPNGRAIDIMIPSYSSTSGIHLGDTIAADFQANAAKSNVSYIIWRQKQWNAAYPERGWRQMEDRGSITQNHYDHVHVSFKA